MKTQTYHSRTKINPLAPILFGVFLLSFLFADAASPQDNRGLLPEVRLNSGNEDENEKRSLQTELLVTRAETKAIESLQKILKKKKGSPDEADLLHRLAELYMRRSRTGRFFDLHQDSKTMKLSTFPMPTEKGADWIRKAAATYTDVEKRFPKYHDLDSVIFNNAFANQQLNNIRQAEILYQRLIDQKPNSRLVPDAAVALGELAYDQRRFALALGHFAVAEKFPESRVYTYALYKSAWAHYNMKDSDQGVKRLLEVVEACPPDFQGDQAKNRQNLRREALRDLTIFVGDSRTAAELYPFFKKITTEEELGQSMMDLSKLYMSHSKYKDMDIFLGEFMKKHPKNAFRVKANLNLVEANENLKAREKVLSNLRSAAELCRPDSSWRAAQPNEIVEESCSKMFKSETNAIAAKWWEIWQKNKNHKEFSGLLEQALKVVLDNEDPNSPDLNSRFGYAELLFQLQRYAEASENYSKTAESMTMLSWISPDEKSVKPTTDAQGVVVMNPKVKVAPEDVKRLHDADYGALFSLEKSVEKKANATVDAKRKWLAQTYLSRHPKGEHAGDVTMRMAVLFYEGQDLASAKKWLEPLLAGKHGRTLQVKAEDLTLDILNLEKNYQGLASHSKAFQALEKDETRKKSLKKIEVEAAYAGLQEDIKKLDKDQAATKLREFSEAHKGMSLSSEALFQSAALDFVNGRGLAAADSIKAFAAVAPGDKRVTDALRDSARASAEAGEMTKAAELLTKLADRDTKNRSTHLENAADFLLMEGRTKQARGVYNLLLPNAPTADRVRLYTKVLETLKDDPNSSEARKLESLILSQNLEPFATKILTERAEALFSSGKKPEAFEAARKIMSREAPADLRARARLIQARILEGEFLQQSVKSSSAERFGMVLAMKFEKLEKAQTAFLSASKMSPEAQIQADAFGGIDRCYSHLVDAIESIQIPAALSPADQQALKAELANMLGPLKGKRDENRKQIRGLASVAVSNASGQQWADLSGDASPAPLVAGQWAFLKPYVPANWPEKASGFSRQDISDKKPSCDEKKPEFARCFAAGKIETAEKVARDMTQDKANRIRGWHHLALVADARGLKTKALWLLRLAEKENPHHPLVRYEKGRLLSQLEDTNAASADFAEVLNSSMSSTEIEILKGFKAFSEGDAKTVQTIFSGFSKKELYHLNLGPVLSESIAQLGDSDKALKLISELAAMGSDVELLVQQGRLNEVYKFAPVPALEAYEKARKLAKDPAQRDWLGRKTEYLKVNFKVGLHVTPEGL